MGMVGVYPPIMSMPVTQLVGHKHAHELAVTRQKIFVQQEQEIGLVNKVVPAEELM